MKTLAEISGRQKAFVMIGVLMALLLSSLDQTIIGTAMPRIVKDLNGLSELSWVFTAYMLASTVTVPIYGKLSDIYGRKKFLLSGIIIFLLGSALSGQSHNMTELILFRGLQGIGAGAMMANAFAIVADLFPPAQRGKWQGIMGGVFGLSSVVGPTLGGWITDNVSWRWNFYINLPVGVVAILFIYFLMPKIKSHVEGKRSIDYFGATALTLGLVPLLLGLVWGGSQYGWNSWQIIGSFIVSFVFLVSFIFIEKTAKEPIMPLSLFKNRIFDTSIIITFLTSMGMFSAILYIPLFAQGVVGTSATNSGIILLPMMIGLIASSTISGQIISRSGRYKILAVTGTIIITSAMFGLSRMGANTSQSELFVRMLILGVGIGTTMPIFNIAVQNAFPRREIGVVTASVQLFRSIGGTVGTAIMGGVLNNALSRNIANTDFTNNAFVEFMSKTQRSFSISNLNANSVQGFLAKDTQNQIQTQLHQLPTTVQHPVLQGFADFMSSLKGILASSISEVFLIGFFLMVIAMIISFFLPEIPLKKSNKPQTEQQE